MKSILLALLVCVTVLAGCATHRDGSSVWAAGLWLIPWGLGLGSAWSFYRAWRAWQSGSWWRDQRGRRHESNEKVKLTSIGAFWYGAVLASICIGVIIAVNAMR